jgi:tetratricopeptide (TPR) repeat protein
MNSSSYSWAQPKSPISSEILGVLPSPATFRSIYEDIDVLTARLHNEAGVIQTDSSPEMLAGLAAAYEHVGQFENVAYVLDAASRMDYTGHEQDQIAWSIWRARLRCRTGDARGALGLLESELAFAEKVKARDAVGELLTALALVDLMIGALPSALARLDAAFSIAREIKSVPAKAHALSAVGVVYLLQGDHREAHAILNRASLLHQRTADRNSLSKVYNNIGVMLHNMGAHTDAIPFVELGLEFGSTSPDLLTVIGSLNNNIRTFEECYQTGASHFRDAFSPLVELLPTQDADRFGDQTMLPSRERLTKGGATYRSDPYIIEPVVLLSMQPTRSLGPRSSP